MRKSALRALVVVLGLVLTVVSMTEADTLFYNSLIGHRDLQIDSNCVTVCFDSTIGAADSMVYDNYSYQLLGPVFHHHAPDGFVVCTLSTDTGYTSLISLLENDSCVSFVSPYYTTPSGVEMSVGSSFLVRFGDTVSASFIDSLNSANGVVIVDTIRAVTSDYLLSITTASPGDALEVSNIYYELPQTIYAHPNFGTVGESYSTGYAPTDYYRDYCTHVQGVVGNYDANHTCWDIELGSSNVIVAVVDDGFEEHEDIPASRIVPGYSPWSTSPNGEPCSDCGLNSHGQPVAGLIGASHSTTGSSSSDPNSGVISVAPGVRLMSIKIFSDDTCYSASGPRACIAEPCQIQDALYWAWDNGATITNNSWGYFDIDVFFDNIVFAYADLYNLGREVNGDILGIANIFGSGNTGTLPNNQVTFPAYLSSNLSVGAIDENGSRYPYSSYGPTLDIVAPSGSGVAANGVWSTDRKDTLGRNDGRPVGSSSCPSGPENDMDYVCDFSGTSAACPLATGVAALLLSKDDTLSASAVYDILKQSADTTVGGGISPPNDQYGYGKVDALRALLSITRGDANNDGSISIADVNRIVCFLFQSCDSVQNLIPPDKLLGDANCTGTVTIGDVTFIIAHMFSGGPAPQMPCFAYDQYGSTFKITTDPSIIVSKQIIDSASSYLSLSTDRELHALDLTLIAQSPEFGIANLVDSVELHWSRNGDTVRVGLLDPHGQRMLHLTDTLPLLVNGLFEIMNVEATEISATGATGYFKPLFANSESDDGAVEIAVPQGWMLGEPYPNPFNPSVSFSLSVPEKSNVTIVIYNLLGQRVATVHEGALNVGEGRFTWNAKDTPSGLYFIRARDSNGWSQTKKAVLLK